MEKRASFTSRKLDVIDALLVDPRLSPADFKVGVALIQFLNGKTGALFPSNAAIAENVRLSERHVRTCLSKLRDAGWLRWRRGNRQLANEYQFDLTNLEAMLDYKLSMQEGRKERKAERARVASDRNHSSSRKSSDRNHSSSPDRNHSSDQHLKVTPEGMGIEEQDSQYGTGEGDA